MLYNIRHVISDMDNPFLGDGKELLILDSRNCVEKHYATTVCVIEAKSSESYQMYIEEFLFKRSDSIHILIKKYPRQSSKHLPSNKPVKKSSMSPIERVTFHYLTIIHCK